MTEQELDTFRDAITSLMIEDGDFEDNAYNWGLSHALLVLGGATTDGIISLRNTMRQANSV